MIATTLLERKAIEIGVKEGKTYLTLSETLNLSIRVVRKWGQKVKKKSPLKVSWVAPRQVY